MISTPQSGRRVIHEVGFESCISTTSARRRVTTLRSTRTSDSSDIYLVTVRDISGAIHVPKNARESAGWHSTRVHHLGRHSRHWENPRRTCGESSICLDQAGLKLNNQKCEFVNQSVVYLDHDIDRDGLHPTDEKVRAIRDALNPTNVREFSRGSVY